MRKLMKFLLYHIKNKNIQNPTPKKEPPSHPNNNNNTNFYQCSQEIKQKDQKKGLLNNFILAQVKSLNEIPL